MLNTTIVKLVDILQQLPDKLSGINNKAKENVLLYDEYIVLNAKLDILSAMYISNSGYSDIVSLLNLPRPIYEYKNEHIGEIISIPYTDESGKISGPIEFEVVGVNHHKYIYDELKPTITLMSKNVIRRASFDAKEPDNPDSNRVNYGNNRWSVSNIRQWLNSEGAANEWFTPQHEYDVAPTDYVNDSGFLAGFSDEIKQHFATVKNKTILCNSDKSILSRDFEETEDKVFLLSYTEIGLGNLDSNNPEGMHLAQKFTDNSSRIKNGTNNYYWTRSPNKSTTYRINLIKGDGSSVYANAYNSSRGISMILVLY